MAMTFKRKVSWPWVLFSVIACFNSIASDPLSFHEFPVGDVSKSFRSTVSGSGKPGSWKIAETEVPPLKGEGLASKKRVLVHEGADPTEDHYAMLLLDGDRFRSCTFAARFRVVDGKSVQAAGIIFRAVNDKNYYLFALKPKEKSLYFSIFLDGKFGFSERIPIELKPDGWVHLSVRCEKDRFYPSINGRDAHPIFRTGETAEKYARGQIGFWARSDSTAQFTDVSVTPILAPVQEAVVSQMETDKRLSSLRVASVRDGKPIYVASHLPQEIGTAAPADLLESIREGKTYFSKGKEDVTVTTPLKDKDGEIIGAAAVTFKSSVALTREIAVGRSTGVVKKIEARTRQREDLFD